MRRLRPAVLAAVASALAAGMTLPAGHAEAGAAGQTLHYQYGRITQVADGDTVYVDIRGDGITKGFPVRDAGIQATEMHGAGGRPECHAVAAKTALSDLLPPTTRVRLAAYDLHSTLGKDGNGVVRLLRYVDRYDRANGKYDIDVQADLISRGLGLWEPVPVERARVPHYHLLAQQAMAKHIGIYDTNSCGEGPEQGEPLHMWINYDGNGDDLALRNDEWVRIYNSGEDTISLAGWHLRDSTHTFYRGHTYFTFPAESAIAPHGYLTIYGNQGTDDPSRGRFYLQYPDGGVFPNVSDPTLGYPGKTVYLMDPDLDMRSKGDYPCLTSCTSLPVHISSVQYRTADEYVDLRLDHEATGPVDLSGVVLENDGRTKELHPHTILNPGETLRVWCDRAGTDHRLEQYWGNTSGTMLEDGGDTVVLRTPQSVVLDTYRWGRG